LFVVVAQMLDRSDHGSSLSSAPLPTGMSTIPGLPPRLAVSANVFNINVCVCVSATGGVVAEERERCTV
jgi:hypothetical protein